MTSTVLLKKGLNMIRLKSIIVILLILIYLSINASVVRFYIFYSEDCEICHDLFDNVLPELKQTYDIEYKTFEISQKDNFKMLINLENQFGSTADIPEIFIGNDLIGGLNAKNRLPLLIEKYQSVGCAYPQLIKTNDKTDNRAINNNFKIYIAYFYKIGCKHCQRAYYDLSQLQKKHKNLIIKEFDINNKYSIELNEALCEIFNVPVKKRQSSPMIFIGDKFLVGDNVRYDKMDSIIKNAKPTSPPWEKAKPLLEKSGEKISDRFRTFGFFTIIFAGLLDGVNPCAFATIIFLISYLTLLGKKGKQLILIGAIYTFAVFITYFLIGILGLHILEFIRNLKVVGILFKIIYLITGLLVLIFSFLSFYDFYIYKKGKTADMKLQLPIKIKQQIHKYIREKSKMHNFVIASFLIGFLVSINELFCTGQVYLPTLIYMSNITGYKLKAYLYLVIYNLLFILPLIIIFITAYWGISSKIMANLTKRHLGKIKILMGIFFLVLGIFLLSSFL